MTLAAIDRLVHHATILEMNVESYRRRAALLGLTEMGEIKRDAELKRVKKSAVDAPTVRVAVGSHIMNDAAPIGGAWAQLAQAAPTPAPSAPAAATPGPKTDTLEIVLQPNAKMALKAWMKKGDGYSFTWTASSPINFNFHGEKFNARDEEYTECKKGVAGTDKGEFKPGCDGTHGWSWRKRTKSHQAAKYRASHHHRHLRQVR